MSHLLLSLLSRLRQAAGPSADQVTDAEVLSRFVQHQDPAAFELLFWRHGPMVWNVCRRCLGNTADAEDAFQATFVVLARKAATIGRREVLAGFLYQVALRTALNARTARQRRLAREQIGAQRSEQSSEDPVHEAAGAELKEVMAEELSRLPRKFRLPVILCDLESRSHEVAATELNCPLGTLNSRLARGRKKLRDRLLRRGVTLSALAAPAMPAHLSAATVATVLQAPTASVQALADGAVQALVMTAVKNAAIGIVLCGLLLAGVVMGAYLGKDQLLVPGPKALPLADALPPLAPEETAPPPVANPFEQQAVVFGMVVNETGKPIAEARVAAPQEEKSRPVLSDGEGGFHLPLGHPRGECLQTQLLVQGANGWLGYALVVQNKPEPVRVVLRPPHELCVRVTDGTGQPVPGAEVCFLADSLRLVSGQTNAQGCWVGRLPIDAQASWTLFARKAQAGFDYVLGRFHLDLQVKLRPLPEKLELRLDAARMLRVKTVDWQGRPVSGVRVSPWKLEMPGKPGHQEPIVLAGVEELWKTTDQDGVAVFDWLPERFEGSVKFLIRSENYYSGDNESALLKDGSAQELTLRLRPWELLSGRLTHPDGRPAAGIRVRAQGQGTQLQEFCDRFGRTDAEGRFRLKVFADQVYVVAIIDEQWAAPYRGGIVVRAGQPVSGIDFVLGRATRVHGQVALASDGQPVAGQAVRAVMNLGEIPEAFQVKNDPNWTLVKKSLVAITDEAGRYEFFLGPGVYHLEGLSSTDSVPVTIPAENPPREIVQHFQVRLPETKPLEGRVVDGQGGPVADAVVNGQYESQPKRWLLQMKTDQEGRFRGTRLLDSLVLHASTVDGTSAGTARISAAASRVEIRVGPVASASGRLLDLEGKVLAQKKLRYGIRIDPDRTKASEPTLRFGGTAQTDDQGRFTLQGLVPGEMYEVSLAQEEFLSRKVTKVQVKEARQLDLGDLRVNPEPEFLPQARHAAEPSDFPIHSAGRPGHCESGSHLLLDLSKLPAPELREDQRAEMRPVVGS